jgi:hypothetical protein
MNYEKIYNDLMNDRLNQKPSRLKQKRDGFYFEGHHIIPKCKGGTGTSTRAKNNPNIVLLTAREHFLAHWLLWRIYGDRQMALAFHKMMSTTKHTNRISSSRGYAEAREAFRITNIGNQYGKGKNKIVTQEQKQKQSKAMTGLMMGDLNPSKRLDVRKKISIALTGKKRTLEQINKIKTALKNRPKIKCPHCDKEADKMNSEKWHFNNCLKNPKGHKRKDTNFNTNNKYGCKQIKDIHTDKIFSSIKDAAEYYDVHIGTITRWLKSNNKVCYILK